MRFNFLIIICYEVNENWHFHEVQIVQKTPKTTAKRNEFQPTIEVEALMLCSSNNRINGIFFALCNAVISRQREKNATKNSNNN